jgi:hypothetical protein
VPDRERTSSAIRSRATRRIEGGPSARSDADRHILYVDTAGGPDNCTLYELYLVQNPTGTTGFTAANGAIFHLGSNALRPDGWTSADAAGLRSSRVWCASKR